MILEPYQRDVLNEALTPDENGRYKYSIIVWSDIKKSAKCVHPDTLFAMSDGAQKSAKDIMARDVVISFDDSGIVSHNKVVAVQGQVPEAMYHITTSRGRELVVTGEHPVKVNGNDIPPSQTRFFKRSIRKPIWIKAKDLVVGDRVVIALDWRPFGDSDRDEMYLLGAYIGDGGQGTITTADEEIRQAFEARFKLMPKGNYGYRINGASDWLREHGLLLGGSGNWKNHLNSYTKRVPHRVYTSGWQGVAYFLSGYFDTDGFVSQTKRKQPCVGWGSVSKDLLRDCQTLLASLGINATLFRHDSKLNGKRFEAYKLCVYGREQFELLSELLVPKVKHKRDKILEWKTILNKRLPKKSNGISIYSSDKIVSIENTEPISSIAIEVEKTHTHITNGIVTHNSTIAAAVNLYRASFTEFGEFYVVANDLKQADSRVNHYLRRAIELNPKLRERYKMQGYRITTPSGAYIEAIPIDPSGEAGTNADQVTFSELWGANEDAKQKMWSEMTIPPQKHGHAFRWIESYAGFTEESDLLYSLYELGVKQGEQLWPDRLYNVTEGQPTPLEVYVNRAAGMLCLWNTQPRCPWHTRSYYSGEEKIMPPNQFARIHRNQWVSSTETFLPMEWIYACARKQEEWPAIDLAHQAMVLSADAATSNDNFGLWLGCRHPTLPGEILTIYAQKWVPGANGKIDFQGTEEHPGPELMIRRLIKTHNIVQLCFDPYQLFDMMNRLRKEGLQVWFKEFNQGTDRLLADSQLRDLIRDRRFWHRGEPDLIEHFQNANAKLDEQDSKVRIVKRVDRLKIDLAVAASMGSHTLLKLNL